MSRFTTETFYHIYNHANGSDNLFREDKNYDYFMRQWFKYISPIAETYAYCLMPNHFHVLIRIKSVEEIVANLTGVKNLSGHVSQQFSNLFNSYSKAINKMYERRGSLFNRPFRSKEIDSDDYLTNIIIYIHHNPVHHGFTKKVEDWSHSSYHALIDKRRTDLQRSYIHDWFGGKTEFINSHKQAIKGLEGLELQFT